MCYSVYLSTTSLDDLSGLPSKLYRFRPLTKADEPAIVRLLDHSSQWYLEGQYGGCSCHFRHLCEGNERDFAPPFDWSPEDADDIEATQAVYDVLAGLLASGHKVDLIDLWEDTESEAITVLDLSLVDVARDSFRFFESCKFNLSL